MVFGINPPRRKRRRSRRKSYNRRRSYRFAYNGRRGRRGRGRRRSRNGLGLGKLSSTLTSGFDVKELQKAGMIVLGSLGGNFVTKLLVNVVPIDALKTAPGNYVLGLISSGILGAAAKFVAPSMAGPAAFGAILDVVMRATNRYLLPLLKLTPLNGLADYLTVANAAGARPLNGLADYLTVANAAGARPLNGLADDDLDGLADYLTVANAAGARPLNGLSNIHGEGDVGDELACM